MPWIARDKTGDDEYRLFGVKPNRLFMVSYDGERLKQFTWSINDPSGRHQIESYGPLSNSENTTIPAADCPVELEPGEGPIEVVLSLKAAVSPRTFEGEGI